MKLRHFLLLLGICFHDWASADDAVHSAEYGSYSVDEIESIDNGIHTVDGNYGKTLVRIDIKNEATTMDLSNKNLKAIRNHALDTLTNITVLDLSRNKIQEFKAGVFSKLNNLKKLSLATDLNHRDRLPLKLTKNFFNGLNNLESLDLSGYNLPKLKAEYFAGLPKFVNITVTSGTLKSLSTAVFKYHSDLAPTMEVPTEELREPMDFNSNVYPVKTAIYRACMMDDILESVKETPELDNCTDSIELDTIKGSIIKFSYLNIKGFGKNWFQITTPYIKKILFSNNYITVITSELTNDLPSNIVEIEFSKNNIKTIKNDGMVNHNLRKLIFDHNHIDTLENGAFAKLNLTELNILFSPFNSTGFISTLPATLEKFYFIGNLATEINSGIFSHSKKLKELGILNHKLKNRPVGLFDGLENLLKIDFSFNNLDIIRRGTFANKSINELSLSNNHISIIETGAFDGARIVKINLARNSLKEFKRELFNGIIGSQLREIRMEWNELRNIEVGVFNDLENLELINLDDNEITEIQPDTFKGLKLLKLDLSANKLVIIRRGTFANKSINELSLSKNDISIIETGAFDGARIVKINLAWNSLKEFRRELFNGIIGSQLRELRMEGNELRNIEVGVFNGLENLELINLSYNKIKEIQPDTFKGLKLLKLDLSANKLVIIRRGIFSNMSINELNLRDNRISSIEAGAFDGAHIVELDLAANLLKEFKEESFHGISGVKRFSLESNPLITIEKGSMLNLREAKYVNLKSTKITALENGTLFGLSTDDVDVIVREAPITLIQGGVFDEAPEN